MSEDGGKATRRSGIADSRSWAALILFGVIAGATIWRWHQAAWLWGVVLGLALLRSAAFVLGARALGRDPEEDLDHKHAADASPTPPAP